MSNYGNHFSRRNFIKTTSLVSGFASFSHLGLKYNNNKSDRLHHACIGVGGMGGYDLQMLRSHPNIEIVAICDVDRDRLASASRILPDARKYTDWRELLEKEKGNIESVNVSVPDHNHFAISYEFIKQGKHLYCQKPMCHNVAEVRILTETAMRKGIISQLGTQHASGPGDRTAVHLLREGVIGKIKHIYLCSNRPGATEAYRLKGPRPVEGATLPPSNLDWDLWIGSAPMRPYVAEIYHPSKWRAWQDFGTGWSGDIGCHILDAVWKGLNLKSPKSVSATVDDSWLQSPTRRKDTWPQSNHITWVFPGNKYTESTELKIQWFDGEFYPPSEIRSLYSMEYYPAESAMVIGTEGALLIPHTEMPVLLPGKNFQKLDFPRLEPLNHYHDFVDACLSGRKTDSDFSISGLMTETVILGTVAILEAGKQLQWDSENMKFPNYPDAEQHLKRKYRKGWSNDYF